MQHLWEVEHDYYCNEGNYFTSADDVSAHYRSWGDFMDAERESDLDLNLVFRWDWCVSTDDSGKPAPHPDDNYRADTLKVFVLGQRKGIYRWVTVEVCRADEPAVIEWLKPRLEHLQKLWSPLWGTPVSTDAKPAADPDRT